MSLGFQYEYRRGRPVVTSVDPRGPAERAGINNGDEILAMDDMSTEGADVLGMLQGEPGQQVVLIVQPRPRAMSSGVFGIPGAGSISMAVPPKRVTLTRYTPPPNWWDNITNLFSGPSAAASSEGAAAAAAPAPAATANTAPASAEECGIGLGIACREGRVLVTEVVPGGPAARSKVILPGDEIVRVDGQAVGGMSTRGVLALVQGPAGTDVVVEIQRPLSETRISVTVQRSRAGSHASRGSAAAPSPSPSSSSSSSAAAAAASRGGGGGGGGHSWSWMFGSPSSGATWGTAHATSTHHAQSFSFSSGSMSAGHDRSSTGLPRGDARYQEHQGVLSEEEALQLAMMESMDGNAASAQQSGSAGESQHQASISEEDRRALQSIIQDDGGGGANRSASGGEQRGIYVCPFGCGERFVGSTMAQMAQHMHECAQNPVPTAQRAGASGERGAALRSALQAMPGRNLVVPYGSLLLIDGGRRVRFEPLLPTRVPPLLRAQAQHGDLDVAAMQELLSALHPGVEFGEFAVMATEPPPRGTDARVLAALPTSTFKSAESKETDHTQCCICQMEYEDGDRTVALPCLHPFHEECVTRWLERSTKCPICKHDVETNTAAGPHNGQHTPALM